MAKTIITLGREYCTGGRYIAEDVAKALGIKLYDKELITMAAKNSGLSEEAVAASEKRHTHSLLYSLYTMGNELPLGDQVFILQSRIIKQLAEEGPCVIPLGCELTPELQSPCAESSLRDRPRRLGGLGSLLCSLLGRGPLTSGLQRLLHGCRKGGPRFLREALLQGGQRIGRANHRSTIVEDVEANPQVSG